MKGYKASNKCKCRDITYEVDKTYTFNGELKACATGFHYCKKIDDVLSYYEYERDTTVIFEIEDLGESIDKGDKTVTNKMTIVRIIDPSEYNTLFSKYEYDSNNNLIKYKDSDSNWKKMEYDSNNNQIKCENSDGDWKKWEYDSNNNVIGNETKHKKWTITIE